MITHEILGDDMQAVVLTLGAGDVVRAEAGALMYMTDAVEMDAKMEGGLLGGLKRKFLAGESLFITFGGEGLFFAVLTGPGRVWLQTLPFSRLAERIHNAYRSDTGEVKRDFGGTLGKIGDLIGGR